MAEFNFPDTQPIQNENQNLPITFCVKTQLNGREGYYLLRWSNGGLDAANKIIHILTPANHLNRFYNIGTTTRTPRWNSIITRKNSGNVSREIRWIFTDQRLVYEDVRIPVIRITPMSTTLPQIKNTSFIPITQPTQPTQPTQAPAVPVEKKFPILTIPQHIVMALLRDAAMQQEVCPITSEEIDVSNGAVTSCFHLFDKNAIMQWLLMPNSNDKCPVCNIQCNSFTLDNGPPPLMDAT
jgi:hypothetical protein